MPVPSLDEIKKQFSSRLEAVKSEHEGRLDDLLKETRATLLRQVEPSIPEVVLQRMHQRAAELDLALSAAQSAMQRPATRISLASSDLLRDLDTELIRRAQLDKFYSVDRLNYPTVYCETLEAFFETFLRDLNQSEAARRLELERLVADARELAERNHGGGTFGVNIPGEGCYLNGWLFAFGRNLTAAQALQSPKVQPDILATAAHEKLGHGFLGVYSMLGQTKSRLGLYLARVAGEFQVRIADDPITSLRKQQSNLLYQVSQLVEEGWSSWVEHWLVGDGRPRHSLKAILSALDRLPASLDQRDTVRAALLGALQRLFSKEPLALSELHPACRILETIGAELDDFFFDAIGQPLRYAVGDLLFANIAVQQGEVCAPYAALIACSVNIDPQKIGLTDLATLLNNDARLSPDTRLAAISQLTLTTKNDPRALAREVETRLSFAVPAELR